MALANVTAKAAVAVEDILLLMDNSTGNGTVGNATVAVPHYPSGYTLPQIVVASIVVTLLMIIVVVGNMLVIIAITTEKALKNIQNWFIASLAVADFFLGLIIMPFSLANELMGYWIFGVWWCDFHSAMDVLLSTASIMNLCLISLDRYWSITQAVEYLKKRTPVRAVVMIGAVWVLSALICIPPLLGWKVERAFDDQYPKCQLENDMENWVEFKTIGSRIRMKPDVVPHKYLYSPRPTELPESQVSSSSKKRKRHNLIPLGSKVVKKFFGSGEGEQFPSTDVPAHEPVLSITSESPALTAVSSPSGRFTVVDSPIKAIVKLENKSIQVKPLVQNVGLSIKVATTTRGTSTKGKVVRKISKVPPGASFEESSSSSSLSTSNGSNYSPIPISSSNGAGVSNIYQKQNYNAYHKSIIETRSRFYLGLPKDTYFIVKLIMRACNVEYAHVLICLKKIRLADPNSRLGDDFGLSASYVGKIFNRAVPILAGFFKKMIYWPSATHIKYFLPVTFRYRYNKVQSIIDCLEMEIDTPSNPLNQSLTWSNYKSCNTVKYLISATPHGLINFISPGYGGRTSDKIILEKSGYLNALPEDCDIMVDRGFKNIAHLLKANCKVVTPPSVLKFIKPTKEEVKETRRIAALRIHIERAIRRLREFNILGRHACVNYNYLYLYDYIVIIACGIVNVQGVLIK